MRKTDNDFFEAFKRLEKLCNDMFGVTHGGVTEYINEMTNINDKGERRIDGWLRDLATLKRLRHIRNQIAHGGSKNKDGNYPQAANIPNIYKSGIRGVEALFAYFGV